MIGPTCIAEIRKHAPGVYAQVFPDGNPSLDELVEILTVGFGQVEKIHDSQSWALLAEEALDILSCAWKRGGFDRDQFLQLVVSKQHDYGHENILRFGVHGVIVRTWDKIARLQNLLARGGSAANESIYDTLIDIVGYSVIGIMLEQGWFTLPLQSDLEAAS